MSRHLPRAALRPALRLTVVASLVLTGLGALAAPAGADTPDLRPAGRHGTAAAAQPATPSADYRAGRYVVVLRDDATTTYAGGVPGLRRVLGSTRRFDARSTPARDYASYLRTRQRQVAASVGVTPLATYTLATNGFAADLSAKQAATLAADPRVASVVANTIHKVADAGTSTGYLGLEGQGGVWQSVGGVAAAGKGIVVGVVDTGIAPENPSFAGPALGTDAGSEPYRDGEDIVFAKSDGSAFRGTCQTGTQFPASDCSTKIVGARYFVDGFGRGNIGGTAQGEYVSPRDGSSHGSHTASTAAGDADVAARGAHISGVTPAAKIAVYKACWSGPVATAEDDDGCATADLLSAIDAAVHDGVDVINYSIGAGAASTTDSVTDQAFMRAAAAGIFVAAAGGNAGPDASTLDNASPWITTVAASTIPAPEATVELGDGTKALGASVGVPAAGVTGTLAQAADVATAGAKDPELCAPGSLDPAKAGGRVVLCDRGTYDRVAKSAEVKRAGGIGMVLVNPEPNSTDLDDHAVPTVHVDAQYYPVLHAYAKRADATVTLRAGNTTGTPSVPTPQVAGFSSRGPVEADGSDLVKPDVAAPGVNILAAEASAEGAAPEWGYMSGTSMASPHVAGLAALYLGRHPNATPAEIKSALMTSATDTVDAEGAAVHDPFAQGNGQVHPPGYLDPGLLYLNDVDDWNGYLQGIGEERGVTAIDGSDLNLASIGVGSLPGTQTVTRTVTATAAGTFTAHVTGLAGVTATVSPSTLTFTGAGERKSFTVTFTRDDAALGEFVTGTLTWTDGTTSVRSALAVRPVAFDAPKAVAGTGTVGSAAIRVHVGDPADVALRSEGLAHGARASGTGTVGGDHHRYGLTVPEGSTFLRVDLDAGDDTADLDLTVYRRTGPGLLSEVAQSATGSADERVDVDGVSSGDYVVDIAFYAAGTDHATDQRYQLTSYVVDPAAGDGSFTTSPATIAGTIGDTPTVTATWHDLEPGPYLGVVRFGDTGISTVVTVDAGEDVPVAPGTPQLRLVTDDGWVGQGKELGVRASGLTPGETYAAAIDDAAPARSGTASSRGTLDWLVPVRATVSPGAHVLHLTGAGANLSEPFTVTPVTVVDGYGSPATAFTGAPYARLAVTFAGSGRLRLVMKDPGSGKVYLDEVRTVTTPATLQTFVAESSTVRVAAGDVAASATVVLADGSTGPTYTFPTFTAESAAPGTIRVSRSAKDPDAVDVAVQNNAGTSFNPMVRYYGCDNRLVVANGYLKDGASTQRWDLTGFRRVDVVDDYGNRLLSHANTGPHRCDEAHIDVAQNYWATATATPRSAHGYDAKHPISLTISNRYAAYSAGFDLVVGEGTHRVRGTELYYEQIPTPQVTAPGPVVSRTVAIRPGAAVYASSVWEAQNPANGIHVLATGWVDVPALTMAALTPPTITAGTPQLTGHRTVGSLLRVDPGRWRPAGTRFAVRWLRDGKAIGGATAARYRLTGKDAGHRIAAAVTGSLDGAAPVTKRTAAVTVLRTLTTTPRPRLHGAARVGERLTAVTGRWRPAATLRLRWLRDGHVIGSAHGTHYRLRKADRGHRITVAVTGRRTGYLSVTRTSPARRVR
ncbi:pre-peptidase C-terminal domain-containing protein [Jatrophihabitans endophyticus]|uniref:Pre-peptidase C-terminal domain-containing protein n=1 Tax=Jatrophihabitans endophyticus TaxID=1206085 RepID=A0A1M5C382_9ACTN|nr:S8 family serine peptidase [Jatrophihabitans endophyticus]SHF49233.1 pre-peptidase C-terminal domain-containing protein [Jatrophihabitans endophyticus]